MLKRSVLKLGLVLPVLVLCISVLTTTALAQNVPLFIYGHVTVNGVATSGVSVSAGGSHATTDGSGYYQLSPSVANGSSVTVTASYQGHSQSKTVTQNMQGSAAADLAISYAVPSATATATPTPTPTSPPSTGGNGGSSHGGGGVPATGSAGYASQDAPKPVTNNTTSNIMAATVAPTVVPTASPTIAPIPTHTSIPTSTAVASPVSELNNSFDWWIAALLGALAVIVGSLYYFVMRKH